MALHAPPPSQQGPRRELRQSALTSARELSERQAAVQALQAMHQARAQELDMARQKYQMASQNSSPAIMTHTTPTNPTPVATAMHDHKNEGLIGKMQSTPWVTAQIVGSPSRLAHHRSHERNLHRINALNARDTRIISKYSSVHGLFPTLPAPDDFFQPPPWLAQSVHAINGSDVAVPDAPPFIFDTGEEAQLHNITKLKEFAYDLDALIRRHESTTIAYGKEFRPLKDLARLYEKHPSWPRIKEYMTKGVSFYFKQEITEEERREDLRLAMDYGNHKSATKEEAEVERLLKKEVEHGFALPIPKERLEDIPGAILQPMGAAKQSTLTPTGQRVEKLRLTHDSSFNFTKDRRSVNDRIDEQAYNELIYGHCLQRVLHFVVALRLKYPDKTIFTAKFDYSDAYRRLHHNGATALMQIIALGKMALIMLRMAFGGTPNPAGWTTISEAVTDLSNELLADSNWDPTKTFPPGRETIPEPMRNSPSRNVGQAREMAYGIPVTIPSRTDDFVDDLINSCIDDSEWLRRSGICVPLAVHVTSRPYAGEKEPIKRRPNLSPDKIAAEGTHAEVQMVLGWELDGKALILRLPDDKYLAWSDDLGDAVKNMMITVKALESLIGRLNHAASILPLGRHFLTRLREKVGALNRRWGKAQLSRADADDLEQFALFLKRANRGMSLNLLVHRKPTKIGVSDSCPVGLGGFSLSGRAWRVRVPRGTRIRRGSVANNVLEFLALAITVWIMCEEAESGEHDCLLAVADNTSALGLF